MVATLRSLAAFTLAACSLSAQAIVIEFDYAFDDGATRLSTGQRQVLDYVAAEFGGRITDSLEAAHYNSFSFLDPGAPGAGSATLVDQSMATDTVRIYVGTAELGGATVGIGGPGGGSIRDRGQAGVGTSDFAPWGGAISFDVSTDWYIDADPSTIEAFSGFDFYSVAVHELGHVLGIGTAGSWFSQVAGGAFTGSEAVAAYATATGSPRTAVPLDPTQAHWTDGLASFTDGRLQEAALGPSIRNGQRRRYTDLDWAALSDVGWEIATASAVPESRTYALMLAGLGLIGLASRRRA